MESYCVFWWLEKVFMCVFVLRGRGTLLCFSAWRFSVQIFSVLFRLGKFLVRCQFCILLSVHVFFIIIILHFDRSSCMYRNKTSVLLFCWCFFGFMVVGLVSELCIPLCILLICGLSGYGLGSICIYFQYDFAEQSWLIQL